MKRWNCIVPALVAILCAILHICHSALPCGGGECNITVTFSAAFCKDKTLTAGKKLKEVEDCTADNKWTITVDNPSSVDFSSTPLDLLVLVGDGTKAATSTADNYGDVLTLVGKKSVTLNEEPSDLVVSDFVIPSGCKSGDDDSPALPCQTNLTLNGVVAFVAVVLPTNADSKHILASRVQTGQIFGFKFDCSSATDDDCSGATGTVSSVTFTFFTVIGAILLTFHNS